jgi:hypothetical protein
MYYNGIDRVDSKFGYTIENSVTCCALCNYTKNDTPYPEWIAHMEKIIANKHNHPKLKGA